MKMMMMKNLEAARLMLMVFVVCFTEILSAPNGDASDPAAKEKAAHAVEVTFYLMTEDSWVEAYPKFQESVAEEANVYCETRFVQCGITSWETTFKFEAEHVEGGLQEPLKNRYNVTFTVRFPDNIPNAARNLTMHQLNKESIRALMADGRTNINDDVGYPLLAVDMDEYSLPPSTHLNMIMIPIAFAVLITIIVVVLVLQCRKKRQSSKNYQAAEKA